MLPIIFIVPIMQLLVLSYTATFEIKNVNLIALDNDRTPTSRELVNKFSGSSFYHFNGYAENFEEAKQMIKSGNTDQILIIEPNNAGKARMRCRLDLHVISALLIFFAMSAMMATSLSFWNGKLSFSFVS